MYSAVKESTQISYTSAIKWLREGFAPSTACSWWPERTALRTRHVQKLYFLLFRSYSATKWNPTSCQTFCHPLAMDCWCSLKQRDRTVFCTNMIGCVNMSLQDLYCEILWFRREMMYGSRKGSGWPCWFFSCIESRAASPTVRIGHNIFSCWGPSVQDLTISWAGS